MLQWMGGSRRKVNTSRLSTQKRQKQFFEQRKRQQQKQQNGCEIFTDGTNPCTPQGNNQSLDILSLMNLSTVVKNYNSNCSGARGDLEGGEVTVDCHTSKGQPIIQTDEVTPVDHTVLQDRGYPSVSQVEIDSPRTVLSGDHDIQTRDLIASDERRGKLKLGNLSGCQTENKCEKMSSDRRDKLKTASLQQLSVFDLLADDGPNGNNEQNSSCEAHVAFAMKGLGEMGTETPVHSPKHPFRISSYGSDSPVKAPKQSHFSKNLNNLLHDLEPEAAAMAQTTDLPSCGSFLEPPFFSEGICNPFNKRENMSTCNGSWRFINNDGKSKNCFADDEMLWEIDHKTDNDWKEAPNFRDDTGLHDDCHRSWDPSLRMDGVSYDFWNVGIEDMSEFTSIGPNKHRISVVEKARKFSTPDYGYDQDPYCKQQKTEDHDLRIFPDGIWSPKVGRRYSTSFVSSQRARPSFLTDDAVDSLSLLSEESCSSSAVRGKGIKTQPSSPMATQKKEIYGSDTRDQRNKGSIGNIFTSMDHKQLDGFHGEKLYDQRKFTEMCKPSISNPTHKSNKTFNKRLRPGNNFLFDEGFDSDIMDPGFSPFCPSLETKTHAFPDPNLWNEHIYGVCSGTHLHGKTKTAFERPEHGLSPHGGFPLEKHPSCQPLSHPSSFETSIYTTHTSRLSKPEIYMDTVVDVTEYSSPFAGSWREANEETLGNGEEDESELKTTNCGTPEQQKDACIGSNNLSSEDERPSEASDTRESCGTSRRLKELTPETENPIETDSPET